MAFAQVSADPYTRLVARWLFPLHERLKRHDTVAVLRELERSQWLPRERLLELQSRRLQALVARAAARVPYYRDLFRMHGIDPASIRTAADLPRLPLLDKPAIRAAGVKLRADDAGALTRITTSGSTGDPLALWLGGERVTHDVAAKWRATRWWGVDIGDPEVVIWASPIESGAQDRLRQWRDRLLRSTFVDARDLSAARVPQLLAAVERAAPTMLFGYASAMARIANIATRRGLTVRCPKLRVIFVTAAKLLDSQRAQISAFFGAPVADGYGGRDAGFIAHECPQGTRHLTEEDVIVEVLRDDGSPAAAGEVGEIVVTHLASGDSPLIRYRIGDRGALGGAGCACGRSLAALDRIEGRQNDLLYGPGGKVMHHTGISNVLKDLPGLLNYRVVQERIDLIRVQLVAGAALPAPALEAVRQALRAQLGADLQVQIEQTADIETDAGGKHRYIVNKVPEPV